MIRRSALSSVLFSPTILLLYDVTRGSPDDEFHEFISKMLSSLSLLSTYVSTRHLPRLTNRDFSSSVECLKVSNALLKSKEITATYELLVRRNEMVVVTKVLKSVNTW